MTILREELDILKEFGKMLPCPSIRDGRREALGVAQNRGEQLFIKNTRLCELARGGIGSGVCLVVNYKKSCMDVIYNCHLTASIRA